MIRRGFWVLIGATGGIMGYRRVTALGRQLSETLAPAKPGPLSGGAADQGQGRVTANEAAALNRQVLTRQVLTRQVLTRQARGGLIRGTIRFTRDARRFSRDVREGMDLYMVRRAAQGSPTLDTGAESRRSPAPPFIEALGADSDNDERVKDDR
jgi:hypothetical protein